MSDIKLIEVNRARQRLAIEHDGVSFVWTGPAALAIIALVEHMREQPPFDPIEAIGAALGEKARANWRR
jgi:hypothetical protein